MHFDMLKLVVGCGKIFRGGLFLLRIGRRLLLKYGSKEKDSSLCKCSSFLGFFMSKKLERLRSELLSED